MKCFERAKVQKLLTQSKIHSEIQLSGTTGSRGQALQQMNPRLTLSQNIDMIFFKEKGSLWDEFDHLYSNSVQSQVVLDDLFV